MKSAPETATPVTDPRPGLQVYTEGQPAPVVPTFTSPPEQPGLRPTMPTQATMPPSATPATAPVTTTVAAPKAAPKAAADPLGALTVAAAPKANPAPVAPVALAPTPAPVAPKAAPAPVAAAPAPTPKAAPSGPASVQIGAFSTNAQAEKGFNDVAGMFPGQMAGKTKRVEAIQRDGETLLRTSVGGFASRADAEAFCAQLQSRGKTCLVR
jgi:cell division protein FtsN